MRTQTLRRERGQAMIEFAMVLPLLVVLSLVRLGAGMPRLLAASAVVGLAPLALGTGEGNEVRAPMAITVIGGLLVSTLLTLVVIPVVYELLDRKPIKRARGHETEQELEATYWESLDQMLVRMDIISVNCPHTPATYHLLSARRLKLLQPEAYIVNTARGEIIDENALIRMIEAGEIAGAGLDVFEHEPEVNPKLLRLARAGKVTLLPHLGSATIEGRVDMGTKVIINIQTFMDGHRPPDRVLPSQL